MSVTPRKIFFYGAAFVCGLAGTLFVLREVTVPLTTSNLAEAHGRWESAAIRDYDLTYRMHGADYHVQIRSDIVTDARMNGESLYSADLGLYAMKGLFAVLKMELENAADANPRPTMRVRFDPTDGHLMRYVRGKGALGRSTSIEVKTLTPR